jgi:two-component system, cell cycle sensor histidine kinase and response regulator CckA
LAGYIVLEAKGGDDAIEVSEERDGPIDVLITELSMPRMDGLDLAERLSMARPEIRVLLMSGYTEEMVSDLATGRGDLEFIEKPFTPRTLVNRVGEMVGSN